MPSKIILVTKMKDSGVSAICLVTTGSHQEGLRVCTSFIEDHQYQQLDERMAVFAENNPA